MLLPIAYLALTPSFSVRTVHVKNVLPSRMMLRLQDSSFSQSVEALLPNDQKQTLVLGGPTPAVESLVQVIQWLDLPERTIALHVEILEDDQHIFTRQVSVPNNERAELRASSKSRDYTLQLIPFLRRDNTVMLALRTEESKDVSTKPHKRRGVGAVQYQRIPLDRTTELRVPTLKQSASGLPYLRVRVTPRLRTN